MSHDAPYHSSWSNAPNPTPKADPNTHAGIPEPHRLVCAAQARAHPKLGFANFAQRFEAEPPHSPVRIEAAMALPQKKIERAECDAQTVDREGCVHLG
jgi:hypothetical protein